MRLLIITPGKLPVPATDGGAVETLIQTIIDDNERNKKYDITLISIYTKEAKKASNKYKYTKFKFINVDDKIYKISKYYRYIINRIPNIYIGNAYIKRVSKLLEEDSTYYDYVIVENSGQYSLILKKKYKDKLILHMHNDFLNKNINMAKKILNSYSKVFSLSNFISNRIREIDKRYENVYTLYNGVELDKFDIEENKMLRKELGIKQEEFVYLYTGRIVKEKGVRELIKAFNNLRYNDVKLVIVGDIENVPLKSKKYVKELRKLCKDNKNIIFTGKISYKYIPQYYKMSNVGVIPSIWEEPFALTVIEHMAVGNPVIISKSGAMTELVNEECAIIVDKEKNYIENLANALIEIKDNYKMYDSKKIKQQANLFSSDIYCRRFYELILKQRKDKI